MNLAELCGYETKQTFEDEITSMYSIENKNEVSDFLSQQGFLYSKEDLDEILTNNNQETLKKRTTKDWNNIKDKLLRDYRNELKKKNLNKKKMKVLINKKKKELAKM